jgi:hypothetical protein
MKQLKNITSDELVGRKVKLTKSFTTYGGITYAAGTVGTIEYAFRGAVISFPACPCCGCHGMIKFRSKDELFGSVYLLESGGKDGKVGKEE